MKESTHNPTYVPDGLPLPIQGRTRALEERLNASLSRSEGRTVPCSTEGKGARGRGSYSPDELEQIEQLASIYLPITDIAAILEVPAEVLREDIANKSSDASARYRKGKATSKVKLYQQEMQLAQVGSPLALETTHKNLLDMEDDE